MINRRPRSQVLIRFQDCDLLGHLNNTKYITYLMNAREDHLRTHYDFDLYRHSRAHHKNWVITNHQISYLRPALPGERVTIETSLIALDDVGLTVEAVMLDEAGHNLKAVQWTRFRYVSLANGRPTRHAPELLAFLQSVLRTEVAGETMDERIAHLKQALREAVVD